MKTRAVDMTTSEMMLWVSRASGGPERDRREREARRVLGSRHGEAYALRMVAVCGGIKRRAGL